MMSEESNPISVPEAVEEGATEPAPPLKFVEDSESKRANHPELQKKREAMKRRQMKNIACCLFFVGVILTISFCVFRQPKLKWTDYEYDSTTGNYTMTVRYTNLNWYPIDFGDLDITLISRGAVNNPQSGQTVAKGKINDFTCDARKSTMWGNKCYKTTYMNTEPYQAAYDSLVEDRCSVNYGGSWLQATGSARSTNGPSTFNVQLTDSYYYIC